MNDDRNRLAGKPVACVGILCADVMAKAVDRLPDRGKLLLLDQLEMHIGGCAANAAIDLARLGVPASIVGKIGNDGFGGFLSATLASEGVDTAGLVVDSGATSASVVAIGGDGERSILHCLGSNGRFRYEDADQSVVARAGILFIAGTFLMPSFDGAGAERLLRDARAGGALCCMDTAWDASGRWMGLIGPCMQYLDWFLPSYEEAAALSGERDPSAMALVFQRLGAGSVAIKMGAEGCYVKTGRESFMAPAYRVDAADASGAGDAWCAGFLAGLRQGWEPRRCARFANAVGACCVMSVGTTTGIRSMEETLAFARLERMDGGTKAYEEDL